MLKKQFNYFFSKKDLKRYFANLKEIALEEDEDEKKVKSGSKSRFSSFKSLMSSIGFGKKKKNKNQKNEDDKDNNPKEDQAMKQSAGKDDIEQGDDQDYHKFDSLNETGNQSVEHDIENQTLNQPKLDKVDVSGQSLPIYNTQSTFSLNLFNIKTINKLPPFTLLNTKHVILKFMPYLKFLQINNE